MSEAPERIWLTGFVKDEYGARLGRGTISDLDHGQNPDYPEYVSADRIEELEAKLAKAVDALRVIEDASRFFARDRESSDTETLSYAHETTRRLCSTTIAELKGEKDE